MPFTLAHPVAVLPLRRWCPRYFDLSALVIGSLVPDVANPLPGWDYFTHSGRGSIIFCLPVSLAGFLFFQWIRAPLVATMPHTHREFLLPLCKNRSSSTLVLIISLLIGIWSHLIWDLFTHDHSSLAQTLGSLPISFLGREQIAVNRLIWIISSGGGVFALAAVYLLRIHRHPKVAPMPLDITAYKRWLSILSFPAIAATAVTYLIYVANSGHTLTRYIREIAEFYFPFLYLTLFSYGAFAAANCAERVTVEK
jgi:hypothetical protein